MTYLPPLTDPRRNVITAVLSEGPNASLIGHLWTICLALPTKLVLILTLTTLPWNPLPRLPNLLTEWTAIHEGIISFTSVPPQVIFNVLKPLLHPSTQLVRAVGSYVLTKILIPLVVTEIKIGVTLVPCSTILHFPSLSTIPVRQSTVTFLD